jgi:hypothetical protein
MNSEEKIKFIDELIGNVKKELIGKVELMPEEWDGVELRWLLREKFSEVVFCSYTEKTKRWKDYANTCLRRNM